MFQKVKDHVGRHKVAYLIGSHVVIAGITYAIMRSVASEPISRGLTATADHGLTVVGKKVVMRNVSYISANRQGPPSWVVRCLETGDIFTSQRAAEMAMNIDQGNISKQLNGILDHANGFHFERICMAA